MTPIEPDEKPTGLAARAKLFFARAFGAGKENYDRGSWHDLRMGAAMDHAGAIAGILAGGATLEDFFGYDGKCPDKQPLYAELMQRHFKVAGAIADAKPEWMTDTTDDGETLLHRVAAANNDGAAEFLAARGAAIEAKDKKGRTPVMLAINAGSFDAAVALAKAGAKIDLSDPVIEKALRVATVEMHVDFLKTIGRLQDEAKAAEKAEIESAINSMRVGTQRRVTVKPLRLVAGKGGAS